MWPDRRLLDRLEIDIPIVQAPMAGAMDTELAIAVALAGALASLPAGMLNAQQLREQVAKFRAGAPGKPLNLNFLAHRPPMLNQPRAVRRNALRRGRNAQAQGGELPLWLAGSRLGRVREDQRMPADEHGDHGR